MVNYGGDEVSALVVDVGSSSVRAGYAGDDTPKAIVSSYYGYRPTAGDSDVQMGDTAGESNPEAPKPRSDAKLYLGQHGPSIWRAGMEIGHPFRDGLMSDFNPIPALISHALVDVMRTNPSEHPILVTEPAWNTSANRERMAEIMFEEFQVPAFYIANTGVLNAFAAGKGSALVVDVGHSMASITPVVDGFVLRKGLVYSALPKLVHAHAKHILANPTPVRRGIELYPHQLIATKFPVEPGAPGQFTLHEDRLAGTTDSWRSWYENREVDEWIQSVASVLDQGWNEQAAASRPPRQYEFPTGYNMYFGAERFQVGEQFFHHSPQLVAQNPNLPKNIPALLSESLRACDPDLRQVLMGNVVLTGGGSLFAGFADRLETELSRNIPHVKIHAPGNPMERRYGGWLGGSILASLGTFHQLWISREEWQEYGKAIVGQRCK
ncbi:brg1-associated factor b [Boletus edulis BED1]|uniref:Brg1-associated factor b n=1 Tax=Boletus edulis BED1 TaxID=1328754 RepID=A0AAD4GKM3_BOLED|nr:brg1-associated factor b [Boletus edulis BED1]